MPQTLPGERFVGPAAHGKVCHVPRRFLASRLLLATVAVLPAQADPSRGTSQMGGGFIEFLMTGSVPAHRQGAPVMQRQPMPAPVPRSVTRGYEIEPSHPVQASRQVAALPDESQFLERREESRIRAAVDPQYQRQEVTYNGPHGPGTIVIDTPNRFLYLVQGNGRALRYGIGVGRPGFEWAGAKSITRKAEWPDWRPPAQMLKRRPDLPPFMAGGPGNPLGARALYLAPRSIVSTARMSRKRSVARCPQAASA